MSAKVQLELKVGEAHDVVKALRYYAINEVRGGKSPKYSDDDTNERARYWYGVAQYIEQIAWTEQGLA